jgi:hypothetical protein
VNLVIIAPSGAARSAIARLAMADADSVTVVSSAPTDVESSGVRSLVFSAGLGRTGGTVMRLLSRSVLGRNLARLTPLDGGHRLARVALRDNALKDAIRVADLVAVLERDGILTGWKAHRRWARDETPVVFGAAPAEASLLTLRAGA